MILEQHITIEALADSLGLCYATVRRLVAKGAIRSIKTGTSANAAVRIPASAVADYLAAANNTPPIL